MSSEEKMDTTPGPTIALPIPTHTTHHCSHNHHHQHHHLQNQFSWSTARSSSGTGQQGVSMAIPGARVDHVPPALPPPRYNNDLDQGFDLAWKWQNEDIMSGQSKLAPIKPGSSLLGPSSRTQLPWDGDQDTRVESNVRHTQASIRAVTSPSICHLAAASSIPSLTARSPSPSGINQTFDRLQGDNPLAQQNHNQSTHAYDKHLLLKIGKSGSSPDRSTSSSIDRIKLVQKLSIQTRVANPLLRPVHESTSSLDPISKWIASPQSAVPSTPRSTSRDYSMDARSPSSDSHSQSGILDLDYFVGPGLQINHPPMRHGPRSSPGDTRSRSERGSYDSAIHAGDLDYVNDEHSMGALRIEERPRTSLRHGTKRRALSPSPDLIQEFKDGSPSVRSHRISGAPAAVLRQPYRANSLSSTASSAQYNSYASSNLSSFASSSMTSVSSANTPVTREFSHPHIPPQIPRSGHGSLLTSLTLRTPLDNPATAMSMQSPTINARTPPHRIGNYYICSCCPKKPKKFDSEEQLRVHENEKQYTCVYCKKRFKNKNEAERHQNSLHLRKQSWSCAAISTYQAAFHPSSFSNPRNLETDVCGFCGEEFHNHPANWEERIDHITNIHKFGECNASKKFYRADHFRQHLKHSHAGKSGKWTNILENTCQREEAMSEPASGSPTASEHSQGGGSSSNRPSGSLMNPTDALMSGVETIDEVYEEL